MHSKLDVKQGEISYDYIRGLVEGDGCFSFCSVIVQRDGKPSKQLIPTFVIGMARRDEYLLNLVARKLDLHNKVLVYKPRFRKDGYKRQGMAMLIVRDVGQIKNTIVPLFYKKLIGNKAHQFDAWIQTIASDPLVPERFKLIARLVKEGFYDGKHFAKHLRA